MDIGTLDILSHQRWLINNNFVNDMHKDNLFVYGSLVHKHVEAVHLRVVFERRTVEYDLYVNNKLMKKLKKYEVWKDSTSIIHMLRLRRLLKSEGNLDFTAMLNRFVKDYCGSNWSAKVNILDASNYRDDLDEEKEHAEAGSTNKQSNP